MEILGFQNSLLEFQEIHNHQKTFLTEKRKCGGGGTHSIPIATFCIVTDFCWNCAIIG